MEMRHSLADENKRKSLNDEYISMITNSYEKNVKELQKEIEIYQESLKTIRDLIIDIGNSLKEHFVTCLYMRRSSNIKQSMGLITAKSK